MSPARGGAAPPSALANSRAPLTWRMLWALGTLQGIARAPSGDFWAAGGDVATLLRFSPSGKLTSYDIDYVPLELAADRSGKLWFTNARYLTTILRFDPSTSGVTAYALKDNAYGGITLGGDGNIWFVEEAHIGKLTPRGALKEYRTPITQGASGLSWSSDGLVWFGARGRQGYVLASLKPDNGKVRLYDASVASNSDDVLAGPNGSVWYVLTGRPDRLVRFDSRSQRTTAYRAPRDFTASPCPGAMTLSSDGSIWYATQRLRGERYDKHVVGGGYVRFDLRTKRFTAYPSPKGYDWNCDVAMGFRGDVWATAGPGISILYRR